MDMWILEIEKLVGRWDEVAAKTALNHLKTKKEKTADEMLMGYALAHRLYDLVFVRYSRQKQTLSDEDEATLDLSVNLALASIPASHPLRRIFLDEVSHITDKYECYNA